MSQKYNFIILLDRHKIVAQKLTVLNLKLRFRAFNYFCKKTSFMKCSTGSYIGLCAWWNNGAGKLLLYTRDRSSLPEVFL